MADYTDTERDTIRTSTFGAMALVSSAEGGLFAGIKESLAGSRALAQAPESLRTLLQSGGLPTPPSGDKAAKEQAILSGLTQSMQIMRAKDPADAEGLKSVILEAADAVAEASKGVSPEETAAIEKVRAALDAGGAAGGETAPSAPQT